MRQLLILLLMVMAGLTGNARETATLSPLTKVFLDRQVAGELPPGFIYRKWNGVVYISALVKLSGLPNESAWRRMGVKTGTTAGDIRTVQIPVSEVRNFAHAEGLLYLQLDEPVHTTLDSTRRLTRADSVHEGLGGLTTPWHGDNVVVGIIDAGFDYRHPTLFDTTGTRYRVKRIWEQTGTGTPPAGYGYGHEITDTLDMWSKGYDLPISHGAHVSGIAAGSGYGSLNHRQYRGLADAADLVLVSITPPDTDWTTTGMASIIDGMSYIYAYAASVGKPAVVNLSWGCSIGPHDGLSLFSQACDNLTGPGRIFVLSAGNNGSSNIHVGKTFTATDSLLHTFPTFSTLLPEKRTWVDIWGDSAQTFCVQVSLYTGTSAADSTGYICPDNQLHVIPLVNATNDTLYVSISASPSEFNGKPRVFISLHNKAAEQVLVSVKGQSGAVNLWSGYVKDQTGYYADFVSNGKPWALAGNNSMTIGDLACTKSAFTVGAYVSRTSYNHVNGGLVNVAFANAYGGLAGFTSRGPTADGRLKPDITAPGMVLGSAVNSYDPSFDGSGGAYGSVVYAWQSPQNARNYQYAMLMGTSMSSPVAAGIVALLLQADPALDPQQVKSILKQTAIKDTKTGSIPQGSNVWGWGKINALGAMKMVAPVTFVEEPGSGQPLVLFPNPAGGFSTIRFAALQPVTGRLDVFDVCGRRYRSEQLAIGPGEQTLLLHTADWPSGIYFLQLHTGTERRVGRLIVR